MKIRKLLKSNHGGVLTTLILAGLIFIALTYLPAYFNNHPEIKNYIISWFDQTCVYPKTYELVSIDPRFNLSTSTLRKNLNIALTAWNKKVGTEVFSLTDTPSTKSIKLSFVFDERQSSTLTMKTIKNSIDSGKEDYTSLKTKYELAVANHRQLLSDYNQIFADYEARGKKLEADISYWNRQGGAPKDVYNNLNLEKTSLNELTQTLSEKARVINALVVEINDLASALNSLSKNLNLEVNNYNSSDLVGKEFEEGLYTLNGGKQDIKIFQYDGVIKLQNILVHEFGHALGLDHNISEQSVMYRLNTSKTQTILVSDIENLKKLCPVLDKVMAQ